MPTRDRRLWVHGLVGRGPDARLAGERIWRAVSASVLFFSAARPMPASADWGTTRWGMSPEEVVSASNGNITLNEDPDRKPPSHQFLAKGTHKTDGRYYEVSYAFKERKLVGVVLRAVDGAECEDILREFRMQHGTATSTFVDFKRWSRAGQDELATADLTLGGATCTIGYWKEETLPPLPPEPAQETERSGNEH